MSTPSTPEPRKYNDAHLMGWAYINEVRRIAQKGNPYYSISIAVIQGEVESPSYLRIRSCNAHGIQAVGMVAALHELMLEHYDGKTRPAKGQQELRIRARFKASDLEPKPYVDRDNEKQFRLHCRLFELTHVYIDNERCFSDLDVGHSDGHPSHVVHQAPAPRSAPAADHPPSIAPAQMISLPMMWGATDNESAMRVSYDVNINT